MVGKQAKRLDQAGMTANKEPLMIQKLGSSWFAFHVVEGECYYTKVDSRCFKAPKKKALKNKSSSERELT